MHAPFPKNQYAKRPLKRSKVRRLPASLRNVARDVTPRGTVMNTNSKPQAAVEQARDKKAALTEDRMHKDKVFYSNAQITKADWDLVFGKSGEKSACRTAR